MTKKISNWKEFNDFCKDNSCLEGKEFIKKLFSEIDLKSEFIHYYEIKVKGENFHSSITTGYAASLINLQDNFYKLLITLNKGKIPIRKNKNMPQMSFSVTEGCSIFRSEDLLKIFREFISEFKVLSPISQIILAIIVLGCFICNSYFDYKKVDREALKEVHLSQLMLEEQKLEKQDRDAERKAFVDIINSKKFDTALEYAKDAGKDVRNSIIKNTPTNQVETLILPTETLSKNQIIDEQKYKSIKKNSRIQMLNFKVLNLTGSMQKGKMNAKVCLAEDPSVTLTLNSDLFDEYSFDSGEDEHSLTEEDLDILWNAQKHSRTVSIYGIFFYDQHDVIFSGKIWSVTLEQK